jgi:hypothetical protein
MNAFSEAVIGFLVAFAVGLGVGFAAALAPVFTFIPPEIDDPETLVVDLGPPVVDAEPAVILIFLAEEAGCGLLVTALFSTTLMRFGSFFIVRSGFIISGIMSPRRMFGFAVPVVHLY